jgi:hypothetical protein
VLFNDNLKSAIFFDVENDRVPNYNENTPVYKLNAVVRLIASANLMRLYPGLAHRATEELICDIEKAVNSYSSRFGKWSFKRIIEGTKNVLSNYNYEISDKKINMQPYYIVAFEYNVNYNNKEKC